MMHGLLNVKFVLDVPVDRCFKL